MTETQGKLDFYSCLTSIKEGLRSGLVIKTSFSKNILEMLYMLWSILRAKKWFSKFKTVILIKTKYRYTVNHILKDH